MQLPTRGILKLNYKAGKPLAPKLSLGAGIVINGSSTTISRQSAHTEVDPGSSVKKYSGTILEGGKGGLVRSGSGGAGMVPSEDRIGEVFDPIGSGNGLQGGFEALIFLLRSLGSPIQVRAMPRSLYTICCFRPR